MPNVSRMTASQSGLIRSNTRGFISGVSFSTKTRSFIRSYTCGPPSVPKPSPAHVVGVPARTMRPPRTSASSGKFTLVNALKLIVRCLRARVPAITAPPNTTDTSHERSSDATSKLWYKLSFASVKGLAIGCCEPVSTMGFGLPWIRYDSAAAV